MLEASVPHAQEDIDAYYHDKQHQPHPNGKNRDTLPGLLFLKLDTFFFVLILFLHILLIFCGSKVNKIYLSFTRNKGNFAPKFEIIQQ
jgi:hypothetical protein